MSDPYMAGVLAILAIAPIVVAVAYVLDRWLTPPEDAQPLVHARPDIAPRCQAAHCGLAAMPTPVRHIDGTDMLVCPGHLTDGCRYGWISQEVAS